MNSSNKPDRANRRQPLGFRESRGESGILAFTAAVAHPCRSAALTFPIRNASDSGTPGIRWRGPLRKSSPHPIQMGRRPRALSTHHHHTCHTPGRHRLPSPARQNKALEATAAPRLRFLSQCSFVVFLRRRGRAVGQPRLSFCVRHLPSSSRFHRHEVLLFRAPARTRVRGVFQTAPRSGLVALADMGSRFGSGVRYLARLDSVASSLRRALLISWC